MVNILCEYWRRRKANHVSFKLICFKPKSLLKKQAAGRINNYTYGNVTAGKYLRVLNALQVNSGLA